MAKIIRVVRENLPPVRFIGRNTRNSGTGDEWFAHGWFDILEEKHGRRGEYHPALGRTVADTWGWNAAGTVSWRNTGSACLHRPVPRSRKPLPPWISPKARWAFAGFRGKVPEVHDTSGCRQALAEHGMEPWQGQRGNDLVL